MGNGYKNCKPWLKLGKNVYKMGNFSVLAPLSPFQLAAQDLKESLMRRPHQPDPAGGKFANDPVFVMMVVAYLAVHRQEHRLRLRLDHDFDLRAISVFFVHVHLFVASERDS